MSDTEIRAIQRAIAITQAIIDAAAEVEAAMPPTGEPMTPEHGLAALRVAEAGHRRVLALACQPPEEP